MGGHHIQYDFETQDGVSQAIDKYKLEMGSLCECQPWHYLQAQTLASCIDCTRIRQVVACS